MPIQYDGKDIDAGYRIDMLVENQIIIENKSVDQLLLVHRHKSLAGSLLLNARIGLVKRARSITHNFCVGALFHQAQLLTYLKLRDCRLGFLINWNEKLIKDRIKRMVNRL